jgi:hypothetical protein
MEAQLTLVNNLKQEMIIIDAQRAELRLQLLSEKKKLCEICGQLGHQFDRYDEWDGHRHEYYYVCNKCQYHTISQPKTWTKDYS